MTNLMYHPNRCFRYCPKCGHPGNQWHRHDQFKCSQCAFEYFINIAAAVTAFIHDETGRLLLVKRANDPAKGTLDLPGGFVDVKETAEDAVKREIQEELNIRVFALEYLMSYPNEYLYNGTLYFTLDLSFRCQADHLSDLRPADDVTDPVFLKREEIVLSRVGLHSIRHMIRTYVAEMWPDPGR